LILLNAGRRPTAQVVHAAARRSGKGTTMALKDILVVLFGDDGDRHVIETVDATGLLAQAHVAATLVTPIPDPVFVGDMMGGSIALGEFITSVRKEATEAQDKIRAVLGRTNLGFEQRLVMAQTLTASDMIVTQARHVDLTVMARPAKDGTGFRHEILEAVLMGSGRPLLLLPPGWKTDGRVKTVFVAWNAGRESARAVGDADDWFAAASKIVIGTVDAKPGPRGHGEAPGVDIATHLARHGFAVELRNIDSLGAATGEAILEAAESAGADLIVVGGYGHPRLQQALFGGVTRTIVESSRIPLLMSH
jgi:nucleotide-binding universal stress UspA family protein